MLGWAFLPSFPAVGVLLLVAATLNLWRLWRWRGWSTRGEPLLAGHHLGYAWVVASAVLLGASLITRPDPQAAEDAFTAGAMGTMILAVMTRVSRGHTGRPREADRATTLIYGLVTEAAHGSPRRSWRASRWSCSARRRRFEW